MEPEDQVINQSMKEHLENVLDTLTPRESGIIRQRYGLDDGVRKTLEQVGSQFNVRDGPCCFCCTTLFSNLTHGSLP